jgi:putative ABC transport system permease protein
MLWEAIRQAFIAIVRNKLRSFLTVLGVVIGVAAVIAMVTVGEGSKAQVNANVERLGTNVLVLRPGRQRIGPPTGEAAPRFSLKDADALMELSGVAHVAPQSNVTAAVIAGNANSTSQITGTNAAYLAVQNWAMALGRGFDPGEEAAGTPVCILGQTVRDKLFGSSDPLGEGMRVRGLSCEVIGVLSARGAGSFGQDQDDVVLMPIKAVHRRLQGDSDVGTIQVALQKSVPAVTGIRSVQNLMRDRRKIGLTEADDFSVTDMKEFSNVLSGVNSVMSGLLSAVAGVSLLVGGIGIMNIMLVSVTERTREIGIRLAVGASGGQVLTQFLVEAIVLSALGGAIGIAVGLGLAWGGSIYLNVPFSPSALVIALAFGFSAVVGVIFGFFPARRAARLDPIEALRHQ